jgi:hypothetical protein
MASPALDDRQPPKCQRHVKLSRCSGLRSAPATQAPAPVNSLDVGPATILTS